MESAKVDGVDVEIHGKVETFTVSIWVATIQLLGINSESL
jgi:hypothetical protein